MTMDYSTVAAKILAMLKRFGVAVVLRRQTAGTYDPVTGEFSGASTTDYSAWALMISQSMLQSGNAGDRYFDGTLIQTGDKMLILVASGLTVTPQPKDQLIISDVTWQIVARITVEPGGEALLYQVLVRK